MDFSHGSRKVQHKLRIERINTTYGIINCACALLRLSRVFRGMSMASEEKPPGNDFGRQQMDDLPGKSHLGKSEINSDKQNLDKGRHIKG